MVIGNVFLIDIYFGVGPCFYNADVHNLNSSTSDVITDNNNITLPVGGGNWINKSNLSIKAGIKIGFGFGDKLDARQIIRNK